MITRFKSTSSFAAAYANELRLFYSVAGLMVSLSVYGILQARILPSLVVLLVRGLSFFGTAGTRSCLSVGGKRPARQAWGRYTLQPLSG